MLAVWQWVSTVHNLSWPMRLTYLLLVLATWSNLRDALEPAIDAPWRRMYLFKGSVSLVTLSYYSILLLGIVNYRDFLNIVRWIQPLVVAGLSTSALLHRWELRQLKDKKELEDRLKTMLEAHNDEG